MRGGADTIGLLAGRVGVVTGASAGIGAAVARALAAEGMAVMLGARRGDGLAEVCASIRAGGGRADFVATDLRDEAQVERLIAAAVECYGQLDALVNNAAIGTVRLVEAGRTDEWRAIFDTNVLGTLMTCRAALRHMLPRGRGDILNMTSASAHEAWPYLAVYAASKAAIHTLSSGLRAEVADRGVRVLTIEIHNVRGTDFASNFEPAVLPEAIARWQELGLLNPQAKMIDPAAVARAVVFQLSQPDPTSIHHVTVRSRAN
jgi:NADP-dependent 3-hydroxy acid dehydrogenase YdfG